MPGTVLSAFKHCVKDLLLRDEVLSMSKIRQHGRTNCLEHSLFVSYISYRICRLFGWDYIAAARGGLLHDLFLYDQHDKDAPRGHLSTHPQAAFENAVRLCRLSDIEKDIILKHMWPLTRGLPRYKETLVVNIVDTLCAIAESLSVYGYSKIKTKLESVSGIV